MVVRYMHILVGASPCHLLHPTATLASPKAMSTAADVVTRQHSSVHFSNVSGHAVSQLQTCVPTPGLNPPVPCIYLAMQICTFRPSFQLLVCTLPNASPFVLCRVSVLTLRPNHESGFRPMAAVCVVSLPCRTCTCTFRHLAQFKMKFFEDLKIYIMCGEFHVKLICPAGAGGAATGVGCAISG